MMGRWAAQKGPGKAFLSLTGLGRAAVAVMPRQLAAASLPAVRGDEASHAIAELEAGRPVATVSPARQSIFRPSGKPYLISWFASDPFPKIARLAQPSRILQGTMDTQVGVIDADLLSAASPKRKLLMIAGMNRLFKATAASAESPQKAHTAPTLPALQGLIYGVVGFIAAHP